jgi:hypothetical protein
MKKILLFTLLLLNYFCVFAGSVSITGYRWRNDNGTETAATWKADKNVGITITENSPIRLRFGINVTGTAQFIDYNLQYSTDNVIFTDITDTASPFSYHLSSEFANDGATTQQISSGFFNEGKMVSQIPTSESTFNIGVTELEYSIEPILPLSPTVTYYFKIKGISYQNETLPAVLKYCETPVEAPIAAAQQILTSPAKVSDLTATGTDLKWYDSFTGEMALDPNDAINRGTYYVTQTLGCESTRTKVSVGLNGAALNFNGGYINIPNQSTPNYTKEAWVKIANIDQLCINCDSEHVFFTRGGLLGTAHAPDFQEIFDDSELDSNTWYHVAVTFQTNDMDPTTGTLRLYRGGNEVASQLNTPTGSARDLSIGSFEGSSVFIGNMDEVRIWNRALTQAEIQENMNCELSGTHPGLMAYYKFNQGVEMQDNTAVNVAVDSSGNGNDGNLINFDLSATASNWIGTSIIQTGNTCTTLNLGDHNFDNSADIKVYPNPSSSAFYVDSNSAGTIEIFDILGKSIQTQKLQSGTTTLDLSSTPNGLYLLKVTTDNNKSKTVKLIKN